MIEGEELSKKNKPNHAAATEKKKIEKRDQFEYEMGWIKMRSVVSIITFVVCAFQTLLQYNTN